MTVKRKGLVRLCVGTLFLLVLMSLYLQGVFSTVKPAGHIQQISFLKRSVHFRDTFDPSRVPQVATGPDNVTDAHKYFIYRCDDNRMRRCGGWADRIKGAMYAYMVANLTGRSFKMEMLQGSCDISLFLSANQINWSLPSSFHTVVEPGPNVSILDMVENVRFMKNSNHDFLAFPAMQSQYLYFKVNREPLKFLQKENHYQSQLAWMKDLEYPDIVNTIYRRLFKPSAYLLSKMKTFLQEHLQTSSKLVCMHLRMGNNPTFCDVGSKIFLKKKHLSITWEFLHQMTKRDDARIFLMSDSEETIEQAKNLSFGEKFFSYYGKALHVDHTEFIKKENICQGYEKIILEQLVLMHCDVLVITKTSGISRLAAFIRGTDNGLYCIYPSSGAVKPCKRTDIVWPVG